MRTVTLIKTASLAAMLVAGAAACGDDAETTTTTTTTTAGTGGSSTTSTTSSGGGTTNSTVASGTGGSGGMVTSLNGCTLDTATDETGNATVTLPGWTMGHQACIVVDTGTAVTWQGNFGAHPLVGGETPTTDTTSPITEADHSSGSADATITFDTAGDYGYFCVAHKSTMKGVIYVVDP